MDWIGLAQYRNRRRALVNEVMDSWVLLKCGAFLDLPQDMLATQEGLYFLEFVSYLFSWFVSKLVSWLVGYLVGWLVDCLFGQLVI